VQVIEVPPDDTVSATPDGEPATVETTVAGQNAGVTFEGRQGQRVSFLLSGMTFGDTCCDALVGLRLPGGNQIGDRFVGGPEAFVDVQRLPASGTYALVVDPAGTNTGKATVEVLHVPPDDVASASPNGDSVTVETTVPGQNAAVRFEAAEGQRVSFLLAGMTFGDSCCDALIRLLGPDGAVVPGFEQFVGGEEATLTSPRLPIAGQFMLAIDPAGTSTGRATVAARAA
jgi:hypothetical protein